MRERSAPATPVDLPGHSAPAVGFEVPLEMLAACHGRVQAQCATLQRLAELAARTYAATRDFTVLHLVTSAHALRLLLPQLPDEAARAAALQAYADSGTRAMVGCQSRREW